MSDNFFKDTLFPAIFENAPDVFPEFGFKMKQASTGRVWVSTTTHRPDGYTGTATGKVSLSENSPYYLGDWAGHGASVWDYITRRDNCPNTYTRLLELAGIEGRTLTPEQIEAAAVQQRKDATNEAINAYLITALNTLPAAQPARDYLEQRGGVLRQMVRYSAEQKTITDTGQERCELGFLPSVTMLREHLNGGGFDLSLLPNPNAAGRLSITLRENGKIVGFKFRAIDAQEPKYLNQHGYEKAAHLIGLRRTTKPGGVILVEGELDEMSAHGAGFLQVAATGGASLSETQIRKAVQAGGAITLAFDNDPAGQEGTRRAAEKILQYKREHGADFPVFVCSYPNGIKDFEEILKAENGKELAGKMLAGRKSLGKYFALWLQNEGASAIQAATGADLYSDLFRQGLLDEAAKIEILLPVTDLPQFREMIAPVFDAYKIDPAGMQNKVEQIRETAAKQQYGAELAKIADKAKEAAAKGDHSEAERLLWHESRAKRAELHAGRFASLLEAHTRADIANGLSPEGLKTGFTMMLPGERIEALEIPAAAISVFAAASGHGKTAVLINIILDLCERYKDKEFHFFSIEESRESVTAKMLNTFADTTLSSRNETAIAQYLKGAKNDTMNDTTRKELDAKAGEFFNLFGTRLFVHYLETATVEEFTEAARYLTKRRPVGAIFADYLQLFGIENRGRLDRIEELKRVCLTLKNCAIETGVPLVFAAQFNRAVTCEADTHRYTNIGEAGDIERVAALIVGLWNRTFNSEKNGASEIMAAKVLKWRGGPVGGVAKWGWDGNRKRIYPNAAAPTNITPFQSQIKF